MNATIGGIMNATLEAPKIEAVSDTRAWTRLKVLFVYEDAEAEDRALHETARLLKRDESAFRTESHRWDFLHPEVLSNLREAACMADVIVIAGRAESELPVEVQAALEIGLDGRCRRTSCGKLIALLGRVNGKEVPDSPLWLYVRELTQRTGLEFVTAKYDASHTDDESEGCSPICECSIEAIHRRAETMTPTLKSIMDRDCLPACRN